MQIPILNGVYVNQINRFGTTYPENLIAEPKQTGINKGYLRPADGIEELAIGPGVDRGAINWGDACYRVMGSKLVRVNASGAITELADVENDGMPVSLAYGFDRLAIASNGKLFYWDGSVLTQVTDPDLGTAMDVVWIDGYFVTTDGEFIVVTDLADPTQVNNLKYGASEANPDPIVALLKIRNELCALNRYTIEFFDNVGGQYFPFGRIDGAQISKGCVGRKSCCMGEGAVFFVGSGINEASGVYVGGSGSAQKISTQEIDQILAGYDSLQQAAIELEYRKEDSHSFLYIHLPDQTLLFDIGATKELDGTPVWSKLKSANSGQGQYYARHFIYCYGKWLVGHAVDSKIGYLTSGHAKHWGQYVKWCFSTTVIYNDSSSAIIHSLELIILTHSDATVNSSVSTSYSIDGKTWSQERSLIVRAGVPAKRLRWFRQGYMRHWRIQRFCGLSNAPISVVRLEAVVEGVGN